MRIQGFTFNPFQENSYLLIAENGDCFIIDPGMVDSQESALLFDYIESESLRPVLLLNTHCHIDHVLGNHAVHNRYGLSPIFHSQEDPVFASCPQVAQMYGIPYTPGPERSQGLEDCGELKLGEELIEWRFVPGHAPGHVVFIDHGGKQVIAGDTLFQGSIGRTDLPGGDHDLLLESIQKELYSLGGDYAVYPGHGPATTIGHERDSNPFVRGLNLTKD